MEEVLILSAKRTPTGAYGGGLSPLRAVDLGAIAVRAAQESSGVGFNQIESIVMGQVVSANSGQNPSRQVALQAGLATGTCATNVNKICASGLKAVQVLANDIRVGQVQVGVAGGMESMSNAPHYIEGGRRGMGFGARILIDGLEKDGLIDAFSGHSMGICGDATAERYQMSREVQDDFAQKSFEKALAADFSAELVPVAMTVGRQNVAVSQDEALAKVNFEKMRTLRPAFQAQGTVTAANASSMSDGASALVMAGSTFVEANQLKPLAKIIQYAEAEHEPEWFTTAPVTAIKRLLDRACLQVSDIDLFEVNEAFALVALHAERELGIDPGKMNVKGGAVALGHALGSSGSRILVSLVHSLKERKKRYGVAAICNGGGGASAMLIENLSYE